MTTAQKAAAWRRAASVLREYAHDDPLVERDAIDAHILAAIVPSLERRAEIIARRKMVGR